MHRRDRRQRVEDATPEALRSGLSPQQLDTLDTMHRFGWELRFVRRHLFLPPVPVAFDRKRERFAVVEVDGSINENSGYRIRE